MLLEYASTRPATQGIKPLTSSLETPLLTARPILQVFIKVAKEQIKITLSEATGSRVKLRLLEIQHLLLPFTQSLLLKQPPCH